MNLEDLPYEVFERFIEGLVRGKYNLLTGAGLSRDVLNPKGCKLPSGEKLTEELCEDFAIPGYPNVHISLPRAYRKAQARRSRSGETLDEWLFHRMGSTTPPLWFAEIGDIPWDNIWTLNIDDGLDLALKDKIKSFIYKDNHENLRDKTALIHVHGDVRRASEGLVFSLNEYTDSLLHPRTLSLKFHDVVAGEPLLIVGASLNDEPDLAQALAQRSNAALRHPTVVVNPFPSVLDKDDYSEMGMVLIEMTAESFFIEAATHVRGKISEIDGRGLPAKPTDYAFIKQWQTPENLPSAPSQNLLLGDEPAQDDFDNSRIQVRDLEQSLVAHLTDPSRPALITGNPYSGKSSLALRVANLLRRAGWEVFYHDGKSALLKGPAVQRMTRRKETLLVIDNAGLYASSILDLLDGLNENGTAPSVLCIDRVSPASRLLRSNFFEVFKLPDKMSETEGNAFWQLLADRGLLSKRFARSSLSEYARGNDLSYLSLVSQAVAGHRFDERTRRELISLPESWVKQSIFAACLLSRVSRGASISTIATALGVTGRQIWKQFGEGKSGRDNIVIVDGKLRPRHQIYADLLLKDWSDTKSARDTLVSICHALAHDVSPASISGNSEAYRVVAECLDSETVCRYVGRNSADNVYGPLENDYAWNSRYWEQRALAAAERMRFDEALEHCRRATSIHDDSFSLNTTATVRLKYCQNIIQSEHRTKQFAEAIQDLRRARDAARNDSEYPYVTFFVHAPKNVQTVVKYPSENMAVDLLKREWNKWFADANNSKAFNDPLGREKLERFRHNWLRAVADVR